MHPCHNTCQADSGLLDIAKSLQCVVNLLRRLDCSCSEIPAINTRGRLIPSVFSPLAASGVLIQFSDTLRAPGGVDKTGGERERQRETGRRSVQTIKATPSRRGNLLHLDESKRASSYVWGVICTIDRYCRHGSLTASITVRWSWPFVSLVVGRSRSREVSSRRKEARGQEGLGVCKWKGGGGCTRDSKMCSDQ